MMWSHLQFLGSFILTLLTYTHILFSLTISSISDEILLSGKEMKVGK